jgi:hypothetical protein
MEQALQRGSLGRALRREIPNTEAEALRATLDIEVF